MLVDNLIKNKIVIDKEKIEEVVRIKENEYRVKMILSGTINIKNNHIKIKTIHSIRIDPYDQIVKNVLIKLIKETPEKILQITKNNEGEPKRYKISFKV